MTLNKNQIMGVKTFHGVPCYLVPVASVQTHRKRKRLTLNQSVGRSLRIDREGLGLTPERFSKLAHVRLSTLIKIENGEEGVSDQSWKKVGNAIVKLQKHC